MIRPDILALFLYGSVAFCCLFVFATFRNGSAAIKIDNPEKQLRVCAIAGAIGIALATGMTAAYKFFPHAAPKVSSDDLNMILANSMIILVIVCSATTGDGPDKSGISLKNIHSLLVFAAPVAALLLFPGGMMNLNMIEKQITPAFAGPAFAEELFFRGYMQPRLRSALGPRNGILAAACASTAYRVLPLAFSVSPAILLVIAVGYFIVFGLAMGFIADRTGNILGPAGMHIFWDATTRALANVAIQ